MRILIYGCGGHGRVVLDILRAQHGPALAAMFVDDDPARHGGEVDGITVVSPAELPRLLAEGYLAVAGIGENQARARIYYRLREPGFAFATAVHPSAVVSPLACLEKGAVLMPGAIVNTGARIGENACVNTAASVDHDAVVGTHAHVFPGARLTGNVRVGRYATVGTGACVAPGVRIGANAVIGAGAVVLRDVPDCAVAWGVPARVVRYQEISDEATALCAF